MCNVCGSTPGRASSRGTASRHRLPCTLHTCSTLHSQLRLTPVLLLLLLLQLTRGCRGHCWPEGEAAGCRRWLALRCCRR